ncbi:GIY-YIG nuclease family protein [Chitinibacter bivalviorum]|uniref:GIY-YIG nuclease family protein n=1 Tax=Chitinibacter bivalviorum TaxID=2739434 RepID=A0A7H9BGC8_9NEIS|nr:NUMOD3 domain-containing DNA-binding protein [Chitinibacter bivalviorum]QLG87635.1 GIY-YIG nuclease family protein [Chitinibacter bivalviorum]
MSKINKSSDYINNCTIYALMANDDNEIRYIGQTTNPLRKRLTEHIYEAKNKTTYKHHWINSVLMRGAKLLIVPIEENTNIAREIYYIAKYKEEGHRLVNLTIGGEGSPGVKLSLEQRAQISQRMLGNQFGKSNLGRQFSVEHRAKLSSRLIGNTRSAGKTPVNKGKPQSAETKAKIGARLRGRTTKPMPVALKNYLTALSTGRKANEVTRQIWRTQRKGCLNNASKLTDEQVLHIVGLLQVGVVQVEIAEQYHISQTLVSRIRRGEAWTHLTKPEENPLCPLRIPGVDSRTGIAKTPEHRAKISAALRGRSSPWTAERNRANKGKPGHSISVEVRQKISEANTGRKKEWLAQANQNRNWSQESRDKISEANRVLTNSDIREIKRLLAEGFMNGTAIARQFKVSPSLISQIKLGKKYLGIK